jgi:hypothetical protein
MVAFVSGVLGVRSDAITETWRILESNSAYIKAAGVDDILDEIWSSPWRGHAWESTGDLICIRRNGAQIKVFVLMKSRAVFLIWP